MSVRDNLKLPNDGGEILKSQGRGWAVQLPAVKSPLCLMEYMPGGQLPPMLWSWPVGLCLKKILFLLKKERSKCSVIMVTC